MKKRRELVSFKCPDTGSSVYEISGIAVTVNSYRNQISEFSGGYVFCLKGKTFLARTNSVLGTRNTAIFKLAAQAFSQQVGTN